jgi:uncharacterized membrane protein YedE/YeeE
MVFGVVLSWSGMTSPNVIRQALLFERSYLFLFFASAVATAALGLALLRRFQRTAALTGRPLTWTGERPRRRHVIGALVFGLGWGIADACPGPIATQAGQGIAWGLFTLAGVVTGVYAYLRRQQLETEPACDPAPVAPATGVLTARPATGATPLQTAVRS